MTDIASIGLEIKSRGLQTGINRMRDLEREGGRTENTMRRVGGAATAMGAAIIAAAGGASFARIIRETASFEDAMLGLQAVSGATEQQMQSLEQQARTLGATSMFSAQQAGEAQRFLAMAGFEVNEVMSATPGILNLATAASIDLGRAADIASNVLGGFQLNVSELSRVNDVLAATAAGSNTSIEQLGDALSYAAPIAAAAGVSIEETAAAIGTLSDSGLQASRAGTGVLGFIRQLSNLTPDATSALESYGLTAAEVNVENEGLATVLERLRQANINTADSFRIFGSEAGPAAQILAAGAQRVDEFTGSLRNAEGAAENAALIIGSGLTGSMRGFNSMVSESILQLGESGLAGAFEAATDRATGLLAVYNGMLDEFAQANNLTDEQVASIQSMANAIDVAATSALALATVYAGSLAGSTLAAASASAKKALESQKAAAAEAQAAVAATRRTAAERQTAFALLNTAKLEAQATRGTAAHTFALTQLSVARTRAATAAGAHTAAINVATAATARASVAARGLSGALALVGGPLGLLVGAGGLMYTFREELGLVRNAAEPTTQRIDNLTDALNRNSVAAVEAGIVNMASEYFVLGQRAAKATAEIERLTEAQENDRQGAQARLQNNMRLREMGEELAQITTEQEAAGEAANELREVLKGIGETTPPATNSLTDLGLSTDELAKGAKDAEKETDQFATALQSLQDRLYPVAAAARQYQSEQALLTQGFMQGKLSIMEYLDALQRLKEAQLSSSTAGQTYGSIFNPAQGPQETANPWQEWLASAESAFTNFDEMNAEVARNFTSNFGNMFADVVFQQSSFTDGFQSMMQGLARSVVAAIGEMIAQWLAYQAVTAALGFIGGGPVGGLFAGFFDKGGRIPSGQVGMVGEVGPELVRGPAQVTSRRETAQMMQGGGVTVNVNNAPPGTQVNERIMDGKQIIDVFVADMSSNGRSAKALQSNFGLQRQGR